MEVVCNVLELCLNGANKYKIIHEAKLTTSAFNKYLNKLLSSGFLAVHVAYASGKYPSVNVVFETTKSGVNFLEACVDMLNMLAEVKTQTDTPMEETPIRA